jgi:nucleoside-diphosphate-sugar epimerase
MSNIYFVTGGSGYVGKVLLKKVLEENLADKVIVLDKDELREDFKNNTKVVFIKKNLVENWEEEVAKFAPTHVVHLAWQIRTMYGKKKLQNHWNIDGSERVFNFVKNTPSVKTFVHFSTVASYGAFPDNTFEKVFTEEDKFRVTNYLYAEEKRIVEEVLQKVFAQNDSSKNIFVIRPASITGPSGRERSSFGLQSALSGKIASQNFLFKIISKVLQFMPGTHGWARQFVFEEDIVNAVLTMFKEEKKWSGINVYNLCPKEVDQNSKNYIDANEMGQMLGKKVIFFPPVLVRVLCFFAWHLTLGKIPTSSGVWKAYSYPIVVDGRKIEKDFPTFKYKKTIREAYQSK